MDFLNYDTTYPDGEDPIEARLPGTLYKDSPDLKQIHYQSLMDTIEILKKRLEEALQFVAFAQDHAKCILDEAHTSPKTPS